MVHRTRRRLFAGLIGVVASLAGASALAFAATTPSSGAVSTTAGTTPPVAVENFSYPGADRILTDKGILVKKGDGRILLADCDQTIGQIRILTVEDGSAGRAGTYCFQATAKTGYLTLELPRVFALEAADHPISADLTANGETTTVKVPKDGFEPVGEGLPGGARSVLVEIRVTG
ncbi:hypothetical protein ACH41E_30535 [Streptomyces sp. NPDC020412]|uniref:hypothetical protein n=1 Tax=Streptomyces sp. NPDC020412 TaxID=3365073 RepID=UPI003787EBFF